MAVCIAFSLAGLSLLAAEKRSFDIPAGAADKALREFIAQSGSELVYPAEIARGVKSNAVKGEFTAKEALQRIVAGSDLLVAQDAKTGVLTVSRTSGPNGGRMVAPSSGRPTQQTASETKEVVQMDAFNVTAIGQRYVNQDAIQSKRVAPGVFDSISQDDIGKLPDMNIADSYQRIPGIAAENDEDEGRFVVARGLQPAFNYVTFEGMALATHDAFGGGGRNINIETIPAGSVQRLEAYKTFLPNMDAASIGAYLNLKTRSASDKPGTHVSAGLQGIYFTQRAVPARAHPLSTRETLTFSHTFGANDRFGFLLSVEDVRKSRDQEKIIQDAYSYFNSAGVSTGSPLVGNGFSALTQFRWYAYNNDAFRTGITAKFEYNPTSAFRSYLSVYNFRQNDDEDRFGHQLISLAGISNQTATSGTYARGTAEVSYTHNDIRRRTDGAHYHAVMHPTDISRLTLDASSSLTSYFNSTPFAGFRPTAANTLLGVNYDASTQIQTYQFTSPAGAAYFTDPANYVLNNYNYRVLHTYEYVNNGKVAYTYNPKGERGPLGFEVGGDYKRLRRQVNNRRLNVSNTGYRLSNANRVLAYTPPARKEPFLFLDNVAWESAFQNGTGPGFTINQNTSYEQSVEADFTYVEDISAAYLMGTYQSKRFRAAGGFRYESVDATADTFKRLTASTPDQFIPIKVPAGYSNLLPSATGSFEVTDRFWARAGISKSLGRPDPSDIATLQTVSSDGLTVSRGNPDLKPRDARNYDLSFEYYFAKAAGIASVGLFRKEISKDIFDLTSQETVNGVLATVTQPRNAASSTIEGLELALVRNRLPFVPAWLDGLGFTGNISFFHAKFSYVDTKGVAYSRDTMPKQMKKVANVALSYDWKKKGEVRVAYSFRDAYLLSLDAVSPWLNQGWAAYGQWDVSGRYRISKTLHLDASVRNLTGEHRVHTRGQNLQLLHEDVDSGKSIWVGITYRR